MVVWFSCKRLRSCFFTTSIPASLSFNGVLLALSSVDTPLSARRAISQCTVSILAMLNQASMKIQTAGSKKLHGKHSGNDALE